MPSKKCLAVVGIGRGGKNVLREFDRVALVEGCFYKGSPETKKWLKKNYPGIKTAASFDQILHDQSIDAVIIATPIKAHYELAKKALLAGKHVFVEKPITDNVKQAQELVRLAAKKKRILFVGHIFSYNPVWAKIKRLNDVEPFKHASFVWNKLGTFNEELVFNLASHDVAMALDLFGSSSTSLAPNKLVLDKPTSIKTIENSGMVTDSDIIYIRLGFKNSRSCTIYINRVSNFKNKTITLATNKNVYLWENDRLLKLDKKSAAFKLIYQSTKTPLEIECTEFIKCITRNKKPHTDGGFGLGVVRVLSKI